MKINNAEYITSCVSIDSYPNRDLPEFVFLGRSNVGKSSLINAICLRKNLAYTSGKPGKTLTLNFYLINNSFYLIDVPGYGYAQRSIERRLEFGRMIEEYLKKSNNLKHCFLIIDSRHLPTEDDKLMFDYLKSLKLPFSVVITKVDKLNRSQLMRSSTEISAYLEIDEKELIKFSSTSKIGVETIHQIIEQKI